jgi:nucleoid DNA-binding protein
MSVGKSKEGRDQMASIVRQALNLSTKKEAEHVIDTVISALERTLLNNLAIDNFPLKLNSFGKFTIRHKRSILRKIPFTGERKMISPKRKVKFVALGVLRRRQVVHEEN